MNLSSQRTIQLAVAAVGAFTVVAVSTFALFPPHASIVSYSAVQRQAIRDRGDLQQDSRDYYDALETFQERVENGETGLVRPDPNNPRSVRAYINGSARERSEGEEAMVSDERTKQPVLRYEELEESDQNVIDRYRRAGKCSESLREGVRGFYELCERLVKGTKTDRQHARRINRLMNAKDRPGAVRSRSYKLDLLEKLRENR